MELHILDWIQNLRTPLLDQFFSVYTTIGNFGEIWIVLILILFINKKTRKLAIFSALALVISALSIEAIIKPIVGRPRPFIANPNIVVMINKPFGFSFPSGHASSSFAVATLLYLNDFKYKKSIFVLAILMAFSRLYVYVHYPSDVLAGILLGVLIAHSVYKLMLKNKKVT